MTFLLMGGSTEAAQLATRMAQTGIPYESCVANPHPWTPLPPGSQRPAPCGDTARLGQLVASGRVRGIVDASPPFSTGTTERALAASRRAGVPLLRLCRRAWEDQVRTDGQPARRALSPREQAAARLAARARDEARAVPERWRWADGAAEARRTADTMGSHRAFLDVGRSAMRAFADWEGRYVLARTVQAPTWPVPPDWEILCADERRTVARQCELFEEHRLELLVTRDTGGTMTAAKLSAAEQLGMFVVIMRRPALPHGLDEAHTVDAAYRWVSRLWRPQDRRPLGMRPPCR